MAQTDMQNFLNGRKKAKAYFANLFDKNVATSGTDVNKETILSGLIQIKSEVKNCEGVYVLDASGTQVTDTYTAHKKEQDAGIDRSDKPYFYRAIRETKSNITDPYPSETGSVLVTAYLPIYKDNELKYIACIDMPLEEVVKISHLDNVEIFFRYLFKSSYSLFAVSLMAVALLLFIKGIESFFQNDITPDNFQIKYVFEATILITLALAIFDLSKTIVEEEVLGWTKHGNISGPHKTMVKFLGSIIIALSIEALMLVFKFAITDPNELIYAMYIIAGVAMLLLSLAIYIKFTKEEVCK